MAHDLKLGLNTGYWSAGPPPGAEESIAEAERLGYDSIWTAEAYGSDVLTPLASWGSHTEHVKLGTAIMQMSARTPAATAMAASPHDPPRAPRTPRCGSRSSDLREISCRPRASSASECEARAPCRFAPAPISYA